MKIINIILALLFMLFAGWQLNDPDSWVWIAIYGLVAVISGAAIFNKHNILVVYIGIAICLLGIGVLFPDFIDWLKMGTPNIAEEMKTEKKYIEFVREFFGLIICLVALLFHFYQIRKLDSK